MPEQRQHLLRAKQNEALAESLRKDNGCNIDWAIVMLFYSALHYVDAYLAGKQAHPVDHKHRDDEIERNGAISDIFGDYRRLKDLSRAARYEIPEYTIDKLNLAKSKLGNIKKHLGKLGLPQPI